MMDTEFSCGVFDVIFVKENVTNRCFMSIAFHRRIEMPYECKHTLLLKVFALHLNIRTYMCARVFCHSGINDLNQQ